MIVLIYNDTLLIITAPGLDPRTGIKRMALLSSSTIMTIKNIRDILRNVMKVVYLI